MGMVRYEIKEYINSIGKSYFRSWFEKLGTIAAAKMTAALHKLENGCFSNAKFLGNGVWEFKINTGPGYRIYFSKIGKNIILLLAGGSKARQSKDIQLATELLNEHRNISFH